MAATALFETGAGNGSNFPAGVGYETVAFDPCWGGVFFCPPASWRPYAKSEDISKNKAKMTAEFFMESVNGCV